MCIITHNNVNPHGAEQANVYEANAEFASYRITNCILKDYGF